MLDVELHLLLSGEWQNESGIFTAFIISMQNSETEVTVKRWRRGYVLEDIFPPKRDFQRTSCSVAVITFGFDFSSSNRPNDPGSNPGRT